MPTNSQTGETPPLEMITVSPIVKSLRDANHPYVLDCRMPEHDEEQAERRQDRAEQIEMGSPAACGAGQ